jgi:hypothetical protein
VNEQLPSSVADQLILEYLGVTMGGPENEQLRVRYRKVQSDQKVSS